MRILPVFTFVFLVAGLLPAMPAAESLPLNLACFTTSESGLRIYVDASCSTPGATSYTWNWGDGTSSTTSSATTSHLYDNRLARTITLTASYVATSDSASASVFPGPTDHSLGMRWAPAIYHDTDNDDWSADQLALFNFDGDWVGSNNWDNEPSYWHYAYVYYYVVESNSHYFIGYMFFHPRDWSDGNGNPDNSEHENDMEGVLLMVEKTSDGYGRFEAAYTMAHNNFFGYYDASAYPSYNVYADTDYWHGSLQDVDFWTHSSYPGNHVKVGVEAQGHGVYRHDDIYPFAGYGNILYPKGAAEVPSSADDRDVSYAITPIDPLWDRRTNYGTSDPYVSYGIFRGDDSGGCGDGLIQTCSTNSARPPWGMYEKSAQSATQGLWTTDPGKLFDDYMSGHTTIDKTYVYRSYS